MSKKLSKFLTFKDFLDGEDVCVKMLNELRFTTDLNKQINDSVVGYMVSGKLSALAEERHAVYKIEYDEFQAALDDDARSGGILPYKVTESRVRSFIDSNPEAIKRKKRIAKFKRQHEILKHFNKAFEMKAQLLRTLAADRRREWDEFSVKEPTASTTSTTKSKTFKKKEISDGKG